MATVRGARNHVCCLRVLMSALAFSLIVVCVIGVAEAKPNPMPPQELADALKVLQQLDRYYSQVARPRFGKRGDLKNFLGVANSGSNNGQTMEENNPDLYINDGAVLSTFNKQPYHNINPVEEWGVRFSRRR